MSVEAAVGGAGTGASTEEPLKEWLVDGWSAGGLGAAVWCWAWSDQEFGVASVSGFGLASLGAAAAAAGRGTGCA